MPFGFEQEDTDREVAEQTELPKIYVEVKAIQTKYGKIIPLSILWDDGREFGIDKVVDILHGRSAKKRITGTRYTCRIGMKQFFLFFDNQRWYLEALK